MAKGVGSPAAMFLRAQNGSHRDAWTSGRWDVRRDGCFAILKYNESAAPSENCPHAAPATTSWRCWTLLGLPSRALMGDYGPIPGTFVIRKKIADEFEIRPVRFGRHLMPLVESAGILILG